MRGAFTFLLVVTAATAFACGKNDKGGSAADKGGSAADKGGSAADKGGSAADKGGSAADKAKTTEAREFVKKIYDGARAYFMDPPAGGESIGAAMVEPQLPAPSVGPTPPLGACCKTGGKCAPEASLWNEPTWLALQFSVDDPHYYSYEYKVDGKKFTAAAYGDLDCDGVYSTFKMEGEVGNEGPSSPSELKVEKELE